MPAFRVAAVHAAPGFLDVVAEIDLDEIAGARVFVDANGHYSRREIFRLTVDDEPKTPVVRTTGASVPPPLPAMDEASAD